MPNFLNLNQVPSKELHKILNEALARKKRREVKKRPRGEIDDDQPLKNYLLALIFEKSSTRTRLSFDVAMRQLGGKAIVLDSANAHLDRGESMEDTASVLSNYVDVIMLRTAKHQRLTALANRASVPVINGLTNQSHPCQIIAALMTIHEKLGQVNDIKITWCGDSNNVLRSWVHATTAFDFSLHIASPEHSLDMQNTIDEALAAGAKINLHQTASEAVIDADIITTDCWISLSDDPDKASQKQSQLKDFQITEALMALAKPSAYFMHCLPVYRDQEATAKVVDGKCSLIFEEAENRIHAQKSVLLWVLGKL